MHRVLILILLLLVAGPAQAASIPGPLAEQIAQLAEQGDDRIALGDFPGAIDHYREALTLLPKPIHQWPACGWLMVSIGDTHFLAGDFRKAQATLDLAMGCSGTQWNPFAHLRLGQAHLELGNCEQAADELTWALASAGLEIFDGEHPKYLQFATSLLQRGTGQTC